MTTTPPPRHYSWARYVGDMTRPSESSALIRAVCVGALILAVVAGRVGGAFDDTWLIAATLVLVAGGVVSHLRRDDRRPWLPLAVTIVTTGLVIRFADAHASISHPSELRAPLASLLLSMECCRTFALRTRRDLRFSLMSSAALMAVAASMSLSIDFAVPLALWALCGAAAMAAAYRGDISDRSEPPAAVRPSGRRVGRAAVPAAVAIGAAVVVATAVFLVVPAAKSSRLLAVTARLSGSTPVPQQGGLSNPSLGRDNPSSPTNDGGDAATSFGYFGFSNTLDTGLRGRPDDTLIMRVRASAPDFWRGQSFDTWDGRTWSMSSERTTVIGGRSPIATLDAPDEPRVAGSEFIQTVFLETTGPNVIFAANQARQVYIPQSALFQLLDGTIRTGVELEAGSVYTVVSRRPYSTAARLRAAGDTAVTAPESLRARTTALPPIPARVSELAAELTAGRATTYDKVRSIEAWLGANTKYSLDIPPLPTGADAVEQFLFVDRVGFCEQIASSLVVMLRSQGIPARLAVGYTPGERNPFTGLFEVRARDAHAWAEVYFPGVGWQAFDPTARVPLAGEPQEDAARNGLQEYLSRHLGPIARPLVAVVGALLAALAVLLGWGPARRVLAVRRAHRNRSWSVIQLERLERLGTALGRPREVAETAAEYSAALGRTVLPDPRLSDVGRIIEADAFGRAELVHADREATERLLAELESATHRGGATVSR